MPPVTRKPSPYELASSEAINAMIARVAPAILELLADGVPRSKAAVVAALAERYAAGDVTVALARLAVTGRPVHAVAGDGRPPEAARRGRAYGEPAGERPAARHQRRSGGRPSLSGRPAAGGRPR